ncbi:MAG TPA: T9SS type A sorting domain-containing protein, partial [Chitinophagaceae bacterium]|nr:T9SS type A sorting domain-containing protein [Chitinophagaceae bacterium]
RLVGAYTHPVTWSVTPTSLVNLSPSGYDASLTKVSTGVVTLKAQIQGCAGTINKAIQVGTPALTVNIGAPSYYLDFTRYNVSVNMLPGTIASQYRWYKNGIASGTGSSRQVTVFDDEDCTTWQIRVTTACGEATTSSFDLCYQAPPCGGRDCSTFNVSPVPVKSVMTISPNSQSVSQGAGATTGSDSYTIRIFDMYGALKKEKRNVSLRNGHQLNIDNLPDGNYVLHIIDSDSKIEAKQIRIEK